MRSSAKTVDGVIYTYVIQCCYFGSLCESNGLSFIITRKTSHSTITSIPVSAGKIWEKKLYQENKIFPMNFIIHFSSCLIGQIFHIVSSKLEVNQGEWGWKGNLGHLISRVCHKCQTKTQGDKEGKPEMTLVEEKLLREKSWSGRRKVNLISIYIQDLAMGGTGAMLKFKKKNLSS